MREGVYRDLPFRCRDRGKDEFCTTRMRFAFAPSRGAEHARRGEGRVRALALALAFFAATAPRAQPPSLSDEQKIDALIQSVADLRGAVFIRNGSEYDAKAAADHLRMKREKAGERVKTADEFIRLCGSKSLTSGKPYQIRYADGRIETSEVFLRARLAELEHR